MLLGCVTILILPARQVHVSITESIRPRFGNLDFVHNSSIAKEHAGHTNQALQREVAERRRVEGELTTSHDVNTGQRSFKQAPLDINEVL